MTMPTCNWVGASGRVYLYYVYPLPALFSENQLGDYVFAGQDANGNWVPVYIGQGDPNERANQHHQMACIRRKGATHFHCHLNPDERSRLAEEADLLAHYTQAYQPSGCNERPGG